MSDADDQRVETDEDVTRFGTVRVTGAETLPDVLDILIAGGGPGGTAAAVRAKEVGLSFLVIDYDDLMARIRDYPKAKPIKPGYGGGDKVPFPPGRDNLTALHFDEIDKDEMVAGWKNHYRQFGLNAKIGSEFTGLERSADGLWSVITWNHRAGTKVRYKARNVIIAVGAGVPRRFDVPGDTDGIAFRLDDPAKYVGSPAIVIGGGTSAAEAVIAISNAKAAADDQSAVYWSYRGDKLPRVSKALSEEFFDAFVGNGNVRYMRMSEPAAIVTGPDKLDYLSVRIDRKVIEGRPVETVHLEFPKNQVVACIGTDLPVKFLQGLGIKVPVINGRPMMLVNELGEVSLPGVFLAGDARGPRYLRCKSFDDTSTFEQITQKRNIKAAMWDAVVAVEVIAKRAGIEGAEIAMAAIPSIEGKPAAVDSGQATAEKDELAAPAPKPDPAAQIVAPRPAEPAAAIKPEAAARLVSLLPDDSPDEDYPLTAEKITIGRKGTDIENPEDVYMADHHATLTRDSSGYVVSDAGAASGVWLRVQGVEGKPAQDGDLVWVGAQIVVVQHGGSGWSLAHHDSEGNFRAQYEVPESGLFVGRVSSVSLDPDDSTLSRRHAQFRVHDHELRVYDLGSTNGTYLKIMDPVPLSDGMEIRVGGQRFRFESYQAVRKVGAGDVVTESPPEKREPAEVVAPGAAGSLVTFNDPTHAVSFGAPPSSDILANYFAYLETKEPGVSLDDFQGKPLEWSCKTGFCGLCAIEIVEGADNFVAVDPGSPELDTLQNKSGLDPDPQSFRLACLAKVSGPVIVKVPE